MSNEPKIAVGDGAIGFWKALSCLYSKTKQQRCLVHKTTNVLNKLTKSLQTAAKHGLYDIWQALERIEAEKAFELFINQYQAKYPKVTYFLKKIWSRVIGILRFYSRALASFAHDEFNRIDFCDSEIANSKNARLPIPADGICYAL